jgi:hypothetical protein
MRIADVDPWPRDHSLERLIERLPARVRSTGRWLHRPSGRRCRLPRACCSALVASSVCCPSSASGSRPQGLFFLAEDVLPRGQGRASLDRAPSPPTMGPLAASPACWRRSSDLSKHSAPSSPAGFFFASMTKEPEDAPYQQRAPGCRNGQAEDRKEGRPQAIDDGTEHWHTRRWEAPPQYLSLVKPGNIGLQEPGRR